MPSRLTQGHFYLCINIFMAHKRPTSIRSVKRIHASIIPDTSFGSIILALSFHVLWYRGVSMCFCAEAAAGIPTRQEEMFFSSYSHQR
jgi:hypothetical protein